MSTNEASQTYKIGKPYRLNICDHVLDTIYGQVGLTKVEKEIEKLSIFKRLHNISQLGLVNWIFPCALHTRYTHSIGVMHVAGEMASHINANAVNDSSFFDDDEVQIIRLAGLLHDIGHYPMSHNVEQAYKDAYDMMEKKKTSKQTPTQMLDKITKCPKFLDPLNCIDIRDDERYEFNSEEERREYQERKKNERLINEENDKKKQNGSQNYHHENIGSLIISHNASIFNAVMNNYVLQKEDGETVLNPKFAPNPNIKDDRVTLKSVKEITRQLLVAIGEMVRGNYEYKCYKQIPWLEKYSAMIQLIHSELDADNLDYLLRDATFSGTSYGTMDMSVLLNCLTVAKLYEKKNNEICEANFRYIVGIKRKGIGCVEQFLLNKFMAYTQMILSKYVSILESMLLCFEEDYVIASETAEEYKCKQYNQGKEEGLLGLVTQEDPSIKYYSFCDHYIYQKIYSYQSNSQALRGLPQAIVQQLHQLRAFELVRDSQSECICTGFSDGEIERIMKDSEVYSKFKELCKMLRDKEISFDGKHEIQSKEDFYHDEKKSLFPFRFEQYKLTKQIPLKKFVNRFMYNSMEPDRRFATHYFRLADGIPILDKGVYDYDSDYEYHSDPLFEEDPQGLFNIPDLCVDSKQSCLHQLYPMSFVSLRHYQIPDAKEE